MRDMPRGAGALLALLLSFAPAVAQAQSPPPELALAHREHAVIANIVAVSIAGGPAVPVTFDTGSSGLRILESAVGADVRRTDTHLREGYGDGTVLEGYLGYAAVAFPTRDGASVTTAPIAVHVVTKVSCRPDKPDCPGIGDGRAGVMGVDYGGRGHVFNPLAQLPAPLGDGFIVDLDPEAPRVILRRPEGERFRFGAMVADDPALWSGNGTSRTWKSDSLSACFSVDDAPVGCAPTVFDTGGSAMHFAPSASDGALPFGYLPEGQRVTMDVSDVFRLSFRSEGHHDVRIDPEPRANSGERFFRHFRVGFDAVNGRIGFERRQSSE
ncbi:hypothetical protein AncyloWKF20_09150 [Ancylobacter sp. WKF20]|uniref:hypothetical protein n=1 Tax=Ancylobacter sp. WKF20 TaxID=3039801 RepID=UPI0024345033|nr:hypothetical protein [Ancylobacter sp. WKF20]WGD31967.1 hypothetical protein AncyloWKF20_09150 [Ancylobacter sp. WKF20]